MALSPAMARLVSGAANKYSRGGGKAIKPKEGVNRYRILVPDANEQFWADQGVHWIKDENNKVIAVVGCRDIVYDEPCEIDTAIDQAIATANDEVSKKQYEEWRARKSVLVNVLDRSKHSTKQDEAQILELTPTTFGAILGIVQQYADEGEDMFDPNTGIDIAITKQGTGLNTEYTVNVAAGVSKPVTKAHLATVHDLKKHIEREFFRGDEKKALNFIGATADIDVTRIAIASGMAKTPTAALTSRAAKVEETVVEEDEAPFDVDAAIEAEEEAPKAEVKKAEPAKKPAPAAAETQAVDDADVDDLLADLADL